MKILIASLIYVMTSLPDPIVDFSPGSDLIAWAVVDDVVMGGRSDGRLYIGDEGHAVFEGKVSLENNGGFSSARYRMSKLPVNDFNTVEIRLKGDGKRYQFRVKSSRYDRESFISYFETTGDWQTVKISFSEMYSTFRGMRLNLPNYPGEVMEEMGFLIGNNQAESFHLDIDWIKLTKVTSL